MTEREREGKREGEREGGTERVSNLSSVNVSQTAETCSRSCNCVAV